MELRNLRIEQNVSLALNYAWKFAKGVPRLHREMISEALYILTESAQGFQDRHDNFVGYLKVKLRCGLLDFLKSEEHLVSYEDLTPVHDNLMDLFLDDLFSTDFFTEEEQDIITKRLAGFCDQEIAEQKGVSQTLIYRKRQKICQKILEKGTEYGLERSNNSVCTASRGCTGTV